MAYEGCEDFFVPDERDVLATLGIFAKSSAITNFMIQVNKKPKLPQFEGSHD